MADTSKAQKLASAKKRFKELKDQKKNASKHDGNEVSRSTPVDSMTSSTHSSVNNEQVINDAPLPNYFNTAVNEPTAAFFDHFTINPNNSTSYFDNINQGHSNDQNNQNSNTFFDQVQQGAYSNAENIQQIEHAYEDYSLFPQNTAEPDNITLEYPEVQQNDLFEAARNMEQHNIISEEDTHNLMNYLHGPPSNHEITDAIKEENKNELQTQSNIENLRQLSDQMAELLDSGSEYAVSTSITDLEKRNLELAALYEQEKIKSEQLASTVKDLQNRNLEIETQLQQRDVGQDLQTAQELSRLKDELQNRIQTMGMLVAENTELSANLSQFELTTKQKTLECEELQARLKTSRSLVADLEREINNLKMEKSKHESLGQEQFDQFEKFKQEIKKLKEQKEELEQDLLEAREKLKHSSEENVALQHQIHEVSSKLSLANIKIQQLTTGENHQVAGEVEQLTNEKFALEKQVASMNQILKTVTKERDESSQQYQQYAEQLNSQIYNLSAKIEQLQQDNENLVIQEQNRIKHIGELERQLQSLQNEHVSYATQKNGGDSTLKNDFEATKELLVQTQIAKTTVEENYTKVANEKEMLLKELAAKNESLSQLESMVEQLRGNQPDSVKLLATMESDKVAAARAVAQNKELKQQMEGMNEVFMKLNNDKVELTEQLTTEQKNSKELFEKLQKTEITLQTLADAIEIKDRELSHLRDNSEQLNKQVLQQEQLSDRLRHYEASDRSAGALQVELQEAKGIINRLSTELKQLKLEGAVNGDHSHHNHDHHDHDHHDHDHHDHNDAKLQEELELLRQKNIQLEYKLQKLQNSMEQPEHNKDKNDNDEIDKEVAMKYLEDKFTRTMQEIAELQDEKQRLEHLVVQLQTETETIGEYVALYQHQRMVLKQRAVEKDQQLKQLASDREQMKEKLHKLNSLIQKVVNKNENHNHEEKDYIIEEETEKKVVENLETSISDSRETAKEIIDLLSEIETSNLVQPCSDEFHHCPHCQGQLITV